MSNFKLEVTLKQYTPLLHFQPNEDGACLRASEVKPKLDHFIFSQIGFQNIPGSWLDDKSKGAGRAALRYRMTIASPEGEPEKLCNYRYLVEDNYGNPKWKNADKRDNKIPSLYFAAMGDDNFEPSQKVLQNPDAAGRPVQESRVKGLWYQDKLTLTIVSMCRATLPEDCGGLSMIAVLQKYICAFFALHNFGTRSNKGFGSFGVQTINGSKVSLLEPQKLEAFLPEEITAIYYIDYGREALQDRLYTTAMDDISAISTIMKGGANYTHGNLRNSEYYKGYIFQYLMRKYSDSHSEKAAIKTSVLDAAHDRNVQYEDNAVRELFNKTLPARNAKYFYMRGILGTAGAFEYRKDSKNEHSRRRGNVKVKGKLVERFENPVHFKLYGQYLLLIPQVIPQAVYGAKFDIGMQNREKKFISDRTVTIPIVKTFDINDFMNEFCKEFNTGTQRGSALYKAFTDMQNRTVNLSAAGKMINKALKRTMKKAERRNAE